MVNPIGYCATSFFIDVKICKHLSINRTENRTKFKRFHVVRFPKFFSIKSKAGNLFTWATSPPRMCNNCRWDSEVNIYGTTAWRICQSWPWLVSPPSSNVADDTELWAALVPFGAHPPHSPGTVQHCTVQYTTLQYTRTRPGYSRGGGRPASSTSRRRSLLSQVYRQIDPWLELVIKASPSWQKVPAVMRATACRSPGPAECAGRADPAWRCSSASSTSGYIEIDTDAPSW